MALLAALVLLAWPVVLRAVSAQIGVAAVVEGTDPQTTAAKTSTAGSLIVAGAATWDDQSVGRVPDVTSSLAGTYTKAGDKTMSNGGIERVMYGITYNIGGTRGASHTITVTNAVDVVNVSGSFQEFSGITAVPTVTVGTESTSASTTAPSCSVTVPSGTALVIGIMSYMGASTTATVADGTQISEADENSDFQDHFIAAKFGAAGATTITWTLAAARQTATYCTAFEESGGAAATPCQKTLLGVGCHS